MSHARGPKRLRHCPADSGARPTTKSAKQEKRRRRTDGSGASYPRRAVIVMAILVVGYWHYVHFECCRRGYSPKSVGKPAAFGNFPARRCSSAHRAPTASLSL